MKSATTDVQKNALATGQPVSSARWIRLLGGHRSGSVKAALSNYCTSPKRRQFGKKGGGAMWDLISADDLESGRVTVTLNEFRTGDYLTHGFCCLVRTPFVRMGLR